MISVYSAIPSVTKKINNVLYNTKLEEAWPNNTQVGCHFAQQQQQQPFGLQDGISQRAPTPCLTNTDLCFAGNFPNRQLFVYAVKTNDSILIMLKSLTLFLVNCAADSEKYKSKYPGNTFFFLFEDHTWFVSVLGISGTKFDGEMIGESCALDECI